ncbi:SagB/ThcOx family dehydrogenase [Rossellomorea marisflavi]|uniref:SagB/ThcOx family dehydrogenase n=1 Tax=Rossellomorea marisflavi TaxID=189381 RepID=A0A5D4RV83_9BACI|nr:SagB family peptide dehydrogenase [Rossellomorea marisflavi]KQU63088.1 hypothetical protein ASG66_01350 [Bacillus sp. Leaf406]MCM2603148.1 SagB family peptide dehydrogenase [Rossellomorea marisflavi]MDW4525210.1 SagB family peptide dehydrogenase [Rossellomorea marisflavi]TYS54659.1 SagB/ThcOx family dehydrogenase [Rossellomorea marisflavi]WJV18339.1 SagB family peptide dehydrogenase [Rossellomorea marisflavi]
MKWDFTFSERDTTQRYRNYHRSSSHAPLMQMRKAPRREYEVRDLDSNGKRVKWHMDPGRFDQAGGKTFADVMKNRRTSWNFGERDVTEEELKELLLFSFGISEPLERKRTYPSGGQFYSLEIYLLPTIRSVASGLLEEKVYKLNVNEGTLVEMEDLDLAKLPLLSASTDVGFFSLKEAQCVVVLVGNDRDLSVKYMDLSYRIMLLEAGHMAQNFLLTCTSLGLSSVPLGGFHEGEIKNMLQLTDDKMVLYTLLGG